MDVSEEHKLFKIVHLSEQLLTVEYLHKQFSDVPTKITDVYIPAKTVYGERGFHW